MNDVERVIVRAPAKLTLPVAVFLGGRFLLELGLLAAIGYWASSYGNARFEQIALAAAAVFVAAVVWAAFVSPRAMVRLPEGGRLTVELLVVAGAVAGLRLTGRVRPALLLGVAAVVVAVVNSLLRRARTYEP